MTRRLAAALVATVAAACATSRGPGGGPERLAFPPEEVRASALGVEMASKNDEELFAVGTAALEAGDHRRAAAALGALADRFPDSPHALAALHGAGLAHERLGEWRPALERFQAAARRATGKDATEAAFRVAECHYHLGELSEAHRGLDALAARDDLGTEDRLRALAQRGVVELEDGRPEEAERTLRRAVSLWHAESARERLDDYPAAQAQFYLGEVYRGWFLAVKLDPAADAERLGKDLEYKAQLLLSAQGHYLRAIRIGQPDWAVASGSRIAELYDTLHQELTAAPLPPGIDGETAAAYRAELQRKVRVLLTKAIAISERTIATAERTGVTGAYVAETQAALDRMKRTLVEAGGVDGPVGAPAPADADPETPEGPQAPARTR
jgi:tetratricopeptide (TPR) repeat protein